MADVFKFTEDQRTALKLIGGTVRNLLLFGGSRSGKTLILPFSCSKLRYPTETPKLDCSADTDKTA